MKSTTMQLVATYPLAGGRGEKKGRVFRKGECAGVTTNVYLRKMLEKTKRKRPVNFENKGSGVVYA